MIYTYSTQKRNYFQYILEFLSLSHPMVAFLWLIIYLNIHKQAKLRNGKMEWIVLIPVSKIQRLVWENQMGKIIFEEENHV